MSAASEAKTIAFEADDEFEEFQNEWAPADEDEEDKQQWEEDWDDEDVDDDFSKQLRAELAKTARN